MITLEQWNAMKPQAQFDYVRLLEDTVDGFADADAEVALSATLPHDPLPERPLLGNDEQWC